MSHTPGPWRVYERDRRSVVYLHDLLVADVVNWRDTEDAHLIAAAPEMLELLKEAAKAINFLADENSPDANRLCDRIGTIIAKAEGK